MEEFDVADKTFDGMKERNWQNFLPEKGWNPDASSIKLDMFSFIATDREDKVLNLLALVVALVLSDKAFCQDTRNCFVILAGRLLPVEQHPLDARFCCPRQLFQA